MNIVNIMKSLLLVCFAFITSMAAAQEKATINVSSAGNLGQSLISQGYDIKLVKSLTLTGSIDVRDFYFMRDSMDALAELDMEAVQIKPYTGNLKDVRGESNTYAANEIPFQALDAPQPRKKTLVNVKLPSSITSIGQWAFCGCANLSGEVNLPKTIKKIGSGAFESCYGLTGNLIIPESVETIEFAAFIGCTGLVGRINIPASVKQIQDAAFAICPGITAIDVSEQNANFCSENGVLYNRAKTMLIQCPAGKNTNSLIIPDKIDCIGISAFNACKGLSGDLIIPNSVKQVGGSAFQNCTGFNGKLIISDSLSIIYPYTFYKCSGLKGDIVIPNGISKIDDFAFYGCTGFDGKLVVPSSVEAIGKEAFYNCSGLKAIQVMNTNPPTVFDSTFEKVDQVNCRLVVPIGSKSKYQAATQWGKFANIKESPVITFDSQGGTAVTPLMADIDSKITEPEAPTKAGYTFQGWYKEPKCTNVWNFSTDIVSANIVLYAKMVELGGRAGSESTR